VDALMKAADPTKINTFYEDRRENFVRWLNSFGMEPVHNSRAARRCSYDDDSDRKSNEDRPISTPRPRSPQDCGDDLTARPLPLRPSEENQAVCGALFLS
jgi:hypothetical protein